MHQHDRKIPASLATMVVKQHGAGTRLSVAEQGAFLDGYDDAGSREHGAGLLMDRPGASLRNWPGPWRGQAAASRAARKPECRAPWIHPVHGEVCSPAKWMRPSVVATWGSTVL